VKYLHTADSLLRSMAYDIARVAVDLKGKDHRRYRLHFPIPDPSILMISGPIFDPDIASVHP